MTVPTTSLIELTRLALTGDTVGARTYLQSLLRHPPAADGTDGPVREALTKLMLTATSTTADAMPAVRPARATSSVSDNTGRTSAEPSTLVRSERPTAAARPIVSPTTARILDEVVAEHHAVEPLRAAGLEPTRSILLTGASGVGKTMSARYLAASVHLPLLTLDLAGVMSSLLGQSAVNLRRAFQLAADTPCVFFIDEFDALAKRRSDETDVGELKRLVNVLLLELEQRPSHGLLVAATNHPELLDPALWRRFDRTVRIPMPGFRTRRRILDAAAVQYGHTLGAEDLDWCAAVTLGRPGAHLHRLVRDVARRAVLHGASPSMGPQLVEAATRELLHHAQHDDRARVAFSRVATERLGLSQREVARRLGVSHVQVGRWLRQSSGAVGHPDITAGARPAGTPARRQVSAKVDRRQAVESPLRRHVPSGAVDAAGK